MTFVWQKFTQRNFCEIVLRMGKRVGPRIFVVLTASMLAGCASLVRPNFETELEQLRSGNFALDPDHTFVHFRVDHLGLSQVVGRFNDVQASLDFDSNEPQALILQGRIETASIDLNNPEFEAQLRGTRWLNSEQFPYASFITDSVTVANNGELVIDGAFTLRGVTQPLSLIARFNGGADNILTGKYTLGFSATAQFSRKAFGIDSFAALVGDTISVDIEAEFQQQ